MSVTIGGIPVEDLPDVGTVDDAASFVAEHAGVGRHTAPALRTYMGLTFATLTALAATDAAATAATAARRKQLTANTIWYVDTALGNDGNTGLAAGAGGAFKTIGRALIVLHDQYDGRGFTGTISVAAGTYNEGTGVQIIGPFTGFYTPIFLVAPAGLDTVIVNSTGGFGLSIEHGAKVEISGGFTIRCTATGGNVVQALFPGSTLRLGQYVTLGSNANASNIYASRFGYVETVGEVFIEGGSTANVVQASHSGNFRHGTPSTNITFRGDLTVTDATLYAMAVGDLTITSTANFNLAGHTVTGQRYRASEDGIIQWALGVPSSIPGTTDGAEHLGGRVSFSVNTQSRWGNLFDYNLATASGTIVAGGVGFKPGVIRFTACRDGDAVRCIGQVTMTYSGSAVLIAMNCCFQGGASGFTPAADTTHAIAYLIDASNYVVMSVTSLQTDGFTMTFTKTGSPTGTLRIMYEAERGV